MNPPLTAILALVLCPLPLARADDPPAVTAPGPPSFLYVGGGGLYIHWDDRSADEVSSTLAGPWTTAHSQTGLQNDGLPRAITDPVAPGNSRRFGRIRVIHSSP